MHAWRVYLCGAWQVLALKELSIRGDIHTTTEYLVNLLESEDYAANNIDTRCVRLCRQPCVGRVTFVWFVTAVAGWTIEFAKTSRSVVNPTKCWLP